MIFESACAAIGIPEPVAEYCFAPPRKWRLDFAWPESLVALEVEGGVWTKGRHTRGAGFLKDMEKYNTAAIMGWRVLRTTPKDFKNGNVMALLERAFNVQKSA